MQVESSVYLNSLIPAQVLARGTNLNTTTPSYYAVSVSQGLDLKLLRVQNGNTTTLGEVKSSSWVANQWVQVSLFANGNNLRAQVQNSNTGQYLNASGQWQTSQTWALNLTDSAITTGGEVGLGRLASYTGQVNFDDFSYGAVTVNNQPPAVTINAPAAGTTVSGVTPVQVGATDSGGVTRVEFYVDNVLRAVDTTAPYTWNFDTTTVANGTHTLTVKAYDSAQNIGQASVTFTTQNDFSPLPQPTIPRHFLQHPPRRHRLQRRLDAATPIRHRVAAKHGGSGHCRPDISQPTERSSSEHTGVDLHQCVEHLPELAHGLGRLRGCARLLARGSLLPRNAGDAVFRRGGSTQPVNWFWGVYTGGATLTNRTSQAHAGGGVAFGSVGQSVYIGYPEEFWEINLALTSGASNGWSGVLEYPTAVDSAGNPTAWAPLTTLSNTTAGLTQSGQITFNPPTDWKPASIGGSAPLYYVRIRTTMAGTAPVANTILGDDYTNSNGTTSGVIPAFDSAADTNHDGYLDPTEYANRAPGMNARFAYQSRLFTYGPMRFATNPGDAAFRSWAIDYDVRYLNSNPQAAGLFMDNSSGNAPAAAGSVIEPVGTYATDYASLLYEIDRAIAPHWIIANTAGGGANANPTIQDVQGYFEEFAIRPLANNYQQFESLAAQVASRSALASPAPYAVLDSYPQGGAPTDPRTEMSTLAYYYLLADPNTTFLDYDGGYDTTGAWSQHWFPAMDDNIGQPTGSWSQFATGVDPSNSALTYRIYQRSYTNALVLYKPLSYGNGVTEFSAAGS